jgi:hypothetical protein
MDFQSSEMMGTIHGRLIEVDSDLGLPDGQRVSVLVKPPPPTPGEAHAIIERLAGAWADEGPEFDEYIRNCRKEVPGERPELEP